MEFFAPPLDKGPDLPAQGGAHGVGHVCVGLEAAPGEVGADGGADIFGPAPIFPDHGFHGFGGNACGSAPPARVGRAHGPGDGIVEEDGGTVGGEDGQGHAGIVGHQCVALGVIPVEAPVAVRPGDSTDPIRMGLPGQHQIADAKTQDISQDAEIFRHMLRRLIQLHGDIHTGKRPGAHPAEAGGEAVGDGNSLGGQIFQCADYICNDN